MDRYYQSPIHLAVLHEDMEALKLLKNNPELLKRKNGLGFTACELARLLGKNACVQLLEPILETSIAPLIAIRLKNKSTLSLYTHREFEELFDISYLPTLQFSSQEMLEKIIANSPWLLRHTIFGKEQRYLGAVFRQKIMTGQVANVAIEWINEEMGYGVFARDEIAKESFIGVYTGTERQIRRFHPDLNAYCLHYPTRFFSYNYFVIDAEKAGNEMRFINHSSRANVKPICVLDRGLQHIVFFSSRSIARGEEITFNYGKDYWRKRRAISP